MMCRKSGLPGSQTTTLGNGFDPNATIDLYFDSTDVGLVGADNNGTFGLALKAPTLRQGGATIQIPANAVPGTHWITAIERITQLQAQVQFTVAYLYTIWDLPDEYIIHQPTGINDAGVVTGYYWDIKVFHSYVRQPDGTITIFEGPGSNNTESNSINSAGTTTGWYADANLSGVNHGFVRSADGTLTTFDPPQAIQTTPNSINSAGVITGEFTQAGNLDRAFIRAADGTFTVFDGPGAITTAGRSINSAGTVAGIHQDAAQVYHAFVRTADGTFTAFDPPRSTGTGAHGINTAGVITGDYYDADGGMYGFVRQADGTITTFLAADNAETWGEGINDARRNHRLLLQQCLSRLCTRPCRHYYLLRSSWLRRVSWLRHQWSGGDHGMVQGRIQLGRTRLHTRLN